MGFNKPQVKVLFDLLEIESGVIPTIPTKIPKVLAHKGVKRVAKATNAERGKTHCQVLHERMWQLCSSCVHFSESSHACRVHGRHSTRIHWNSGKEGMDEPRCLCQMLATFRQAYTINQR